MSISFNIVIRCAIVCFWSLIIALFLWLPTLFQSVGQERSLTIFTWPLLIDPIYLKDFEKETGIKLYITYFENGPALLSKMAATGGKGYDIIFPDDHSLEILLQKCLLKKIDKSKLHFWNDLDPKLLGSYFDRSNDYSIPYYWGVYGIGYNNELFKGDPDSISWDILFSKNLCPENRICMTDDPREAILIAAYYLFGSIDALKDPAAQQKVKQLLIEQKKKVEVYTISRADSLLQSKSCGIATIMSPEAWRLHREHSNIDMVIPKVGSFIVIDSIAIPKTTQKDELIYTFLNYLYQKNVISHHIESYGYCSPSSSLITESQKTFCPADRFKSFDFFRNIISDDQINNLWIEVLAA